MKISRTVTSCVIIFLAHMSIISAETIMLSPEKVVELAKMANKTIRASSYEVEGEEYARKSALAALLPSLSLTASYTRLDEAPTITGFDTGDQSLPADTTDTLILPPEYEPYRDLINFFDSMSTIQAQEQMNALFDAGPLQIGPQTIKSVGVRISQPFFTGGALWNSYRIAEYAHEAKKLQHERSLEEIELTSLSLFWSYVLSREAYNALLDERTWLEELVSNQEVLLDNGMITELDLLQTKLALSKKQIDAINSQNTTRETGERLLIMLDLPTNLIVEIDTSQLWKEPGRFFYPTPDSIDDRLLRRYDLRATEYQIKSLERLKNIQLASYAPSIAGFTGIDYTNQYTSNESEFDDQWSIGVSLNWNIFDWGKAYRSMQKYKYQVDAAELMFEFQKQQLANSMRVLVRKIDETKQKVEIAREALSVAERALTIAEARYDQHMITNRDVLNTRKDLTAARMGLVAAKIELILALEEYRIGPSLLK